MNRHDLTSVLAETDSHREGRPSTAQLKKLAKDLGLPSGDNLNQLMASPRVSILNDQPAIHDGFGFSPFIRTLCDIVLAESTQTPLAVALDGRWGTGKTSVMRMIERQARMVDFPCIWLNAWSLESTESLMAAVGAEIQREAEKLGGPKHAALDSVRTGMRTLARTLARMSGTPEILDLAEARTEHSSELEAVASVVTANRSFAKLVSILLGESKGGERSANRLMVFVDDLDRGLPDQVARTLRTLKLVLENANCVFVLAMDLETVARAIEDHYEQARGPSRGFAGDPDRGYGHRYLEKLFQIRMRLPELTTEVVGQYLQGLGLADEIKEIIRWSPRLETLNPRRLKQLINWLSINLQLIVGSHLPKGMTNLTALRALALRRNFPEAYLLAMRANTSWESLEIFRRTLRRVTNEGEHLPETMEAFERYYRDLAQPDFLLHFDRFLNSSPLLRSAVADVLDTAAPSSGESVAAVARDGSGSLLAYGDDARRAILRGARKLAEAVRITLGPQGRYVVVDGGEDLPPITTTEGLVVASRVELADPLERLGAQAVSEAGELTQATGGNGSTTSMVLTHAILEDVIPSAIAGANPVLIQRGLDLALKEALKRINQLARPLEGQEIEHLATIAGGGDPEKGQLIAEAMEKVGRNGVVMVEEAQGVDTHLEVVEGLQFDRGFLSPHFVTDSERTEAVLENAVVLLCSRKISTIQELLPILEQAAKENKPLLIIASDVDGEALATLVVNKVRGTLKVAAVKAPGFGDRRKAILEDLAILTDGEVMGEEKHPLLENVGIDRLGKARKVIISEHETLLMTDALGSNSSKRLANRVQEIRSQIEQTNSDYDREKLVDRLAKLVGGVALIRVGAVTESVMRESKLQLENALRATQAANEEGIVPGGGTAYLRTVPALVELRAEGEMQVGITALRRALQVPAELIAGNAGEPGPEIVEKVLAQKGAFGFNATTRELTNLIQAGVIDPAKVVKIALRTAVSTAGRLLNTEALIASSGKKKEEPSLPVEGAML